MGIMNALRVRLIEALGGSALGYASTADAEDSREGYRTITDRAKTRDLDLLSHVKMVQLCHYLYDSNPMAGFLVDKPVDMVCGSELGYVVRVDGQRMGLDEDAVKALMAEIRNYLDPWWAHPAMNFRERADEYLTTFLVSGHLILPIVEHNSTTGLPRVDTVDAEQLDGVVPVEGSAMVTDLVKIKKTGTVEPQALRVARIDPTTDAYGEAECFYFRRSYLLNSMRGRSALLRTADYVDSADQFLWAAVDRAQLLNTFVWDVTMKGATQTQVDVRAANLKKAGPPKPASTLIHNDSEIWNPMAPDLKAADSSAMARMLKTYILGAHGIPESWYGEGGETNRATAGDQTDVTLKGLGRLQKVTRRIFRELLCYAYDRLAEKQALPARAKGITLEPDLAPLGERDISRSATALAQTEGALQQAVDDELVSKRTARRVFLGIVGKLGVDVDADTEESLIEQESEDRATQAAEKQAEDAAAKYAAAMAAPTQPPQPPQPVGNPEDGMDAGMDEGGQPSGTRGAGERGTGRKAQAA